jgi:type II secretory pathway component PulM
MAVAAVSSGDRYVAAAYLVFLFLVLSYLAIMAVKLSRIEREVVELAELVERRDRAVDEAPARAREPVG